MEVMFEAGLAARMGLAFARELLSNKPEASLTNYLAIDGPLHARAIVDKPSTTCHTEVT